MIGESFGGEWYMPQDQEEREPVLIISKGDLGYGNMGTFGPNSRAEAEATEDFANEKYVSPPTDESHCMDDRFKGFGLQLPGNRAHTEVIGEYMDPEIEPQPITAATANKVTELKGLRRKPYYHGDKATGMDGCAANKYGRQALAYNLEHRVRVARLAYNRMRLLGFDDVTEDEILIFIDTGGQRAKDDKYWDGDAKAIVEAAVASGAGYEEFEGAHHTTGPREDMSANTFDNGEFREDHTTDDGHPLGALSITYGAYVEQLNDDGFDDEEIKNKVLQAVLFSIGILKLACSEDAVSITVG